VATRSTSGQKPQANPPALPKRELALARTARLFSADTVRPPARPSAPGASPNAAFDFRRVRVHSDGERPGEEPEAPESRPRQLGGPPGVIQRKCAGEGTCACESCAEKEARRLGAQRLAVGPVGDPSEREADEVARRILSTGGRPGIPPLPVTPVSRTPDRADASGGGEGIDGDPQGRRVGEAVAGRGRPLDPATRAFFESRFGHDFAAVRIHDDSPAHEAAVALQARAFTLGPHVAFQRGRYAPATTEGRQLLAHELTHVAQQGASAVRVQRAPVKDVPTELLIEGAHGGADPLVIYFRRGEATLDPTLDKAQLDKLEKVIKDHPTDVLTLNGSTSDDEEPNLAQARTAAVEAVLKQGRPKVIDKQNAPTGKTGQPIGTGQIEYRRVRSVEIVLPGQASKQPSCGGAKTESCKDAKYATREENFKKADARVQPLLKDAIEMTGDAAKKAEVQPVADSLFEPKADLSRVKKGLEEIQKQYGVYAKARACDNGCDNNCASATAYNVGVGQTAKMVLCRGLDRTSDVDFVAAVLIHETTHATEPLGTTKGHGAEDFAYVWERLFTELPKIDPARAWRNSDNWTWYVMKLGKVGIPSFLQQAKDDLDLLAEVERPLARKGLAQAQKWSSWVETWLSDAYQRISERTPGKKDYSGVWAPTIDALAKNFGVTPLRTGSKLNTPTRADQIKVAGVRDRIEGMRVDFAKPVKFGPGPLGVDSRWTPGTPTILTLSPGYFGLSDTGAGEEIVRAYIASRADVPAALRAAYVQLVVDIRDAYVAANP
jgi:hypothetical protein